MSKLWEKVLNIFNFVGDNSGCHQLPSRCFCIKGYTFPICARCTGVLAGQLTMLILLCFNLRFSLSMCLILLSFMGADWFIQYVGARESNNLRRFITGICGGLGLFGVYGHLILYLYQYLKAIF